jgi:hypothetical protein
MSSPFPQIRFQGDKSACIQYAKRAMLELYRTQTIQDKSGVPILKRTVPVNDYTEIEVHLSKDQKFIEIRSFPPRQQLEPTGAKEEEFDTAACPAAFVVRKFDISAKTGTGFPEADKEQGYIIAYNHTRKKWEIATYEDATGTGNTFASCANIGWWHARNDRDGYNGCDVVTWYGSSFFDFTAPFYPRTFVDADEDGTAELELSAVTHLQKVIMFKGRKFSTPNYVLGACIIDDGGTDYMYVHVCSLTEDLAGNRNFYTTQESSVRCKLSTLFATDGLTIPWQTVGNISVGTGITFAKSGFNPSHKNWKTVQGTAYVDKDGYSYVLWTALLDMYTSPAELSLLTSQVSVWVKYNLRDLSWEMLWDPTEPANRPTVTGHWSQENGTKLGGHAPITVLGDGYLNAAFTTAFQPYPLYQWSGTKDHYVLYIEGVHNADHNFTRTQDGTDWESTNVGYLTHIAAFVLKKNGNEIERFDVLYSKSNGSCRNWLLDSQSGTEWTEAFGETLDMMVLQWHPDIPESFLACRRKTSNIGGHAEFAFVRGKNQTPEVFYTQDRPPEVYDFDGEFFGYRNVGATDLEVCDYTIPLSATDGPIDPYYINALQLWGTAYYGGSPTRYSRRTAVFSALTGTDALNAGFQGANPVGSVMIFDSHLGGDVINSDVAGSDYLSSRVLGSSTGFWPPRENGDDGTPSYRTVPLEGYAVHHLIQIDGERVAPYIYLERPLYSAVPVSPTAPFFTANAELQHSIEEYTWRDTGQTLNSPSGFACTERLGYWRGSLPEAEGHRLNVDNWKVKSNVLSEAQIKQLTKETDNMLLEIGVL